MRFEKIKEKLPVIGFNADEAAILKNAYQNYLDNLPVGVEPEDVRFPGIAEIDPSDGYDLAADEEPAAQSAMVEVSHVLETHADSMVGIAKSLGAAGLNVADFDPSLSTDIDIARGMADQLRSELFATVEPEDFMPHEPDREFEAGL